MKIYKDGNLWFEATSPNELLSMCQTIANNLQNNYYTNVETMSLIASSRAVYQVATMPSNPTRNTIYYVGSTNPYNVKLVDSNGTIVDLGSSNVDLTGYQKIVDNALTTTSKTIVGAINEIVTDINALSNIYAPLQYYQLTRNSINANNCVFDINLTGAPSKNCISTKKYENVVMTNPVTNAYAYGSMEVIEECSAEWVTITQIFTAFHSGSNVRETSMVFKRIGTLQDDAQDRQTYTNRANIVWKNWFVIEYPRNTLNALPDNTQFTLNNNTFSITGGLLTINIRDLKSNVDVSRVSGVNFSTIPNLHREEAYTFGTLYPLDNNTTETGGLQFQYDYVQVFGLKANVRYLGTLTVPLGY